MLQIAPFSSLIPNSNENEISPYKITAFSNIQVMRIKETITKDNMSWYLDKFSLPVLHKCIENNKENTNFHIKA